MKPMVNNVEANYVNYGVREFAMSAIVNGIALHGGLIPFGATFLMFSEYARNALRMAALMKIRSIFVYTHDSIGLGEDGPTHQPIEQIPTLRLIPEHGGLASLRHGGVGGRLAAGDRTQEWPVLPDLLAPGFAASRNAATRKSPPSPRAVTC